MAWCAQQRGRSSPIVITTDGRSEAMVWTVGTSDGRLFIAADNRVYAYTR